MTDRPDLAALRALAEAATPGPWFVYERYIYSDEFDPLHDDETRVLGWDGTAEDRTYIAACSPERILALIGEVEEARNHAS